MGKVSNPYSLEIKDDYNSYAEIIEQYKDYNLVFITSSHTGPYSSTYVGFNNSTTTNAGIWGNVIKNTSDFNGLYYRTSGDKLGYSESKSGRNGNVKIISKSGKTYTSYHWLSGGSALFKNNDLLNELSQVGSIFACNITYN